MPFELSEDTLNTDEWEFDENENGDGVITHKSTGATFVYNSTEDQWEPSGGIKTPALEAGDLTIKKDGSFGAIDKIANYQYDSGPNSFDETRDVSGVSQTAATISQLPDNAGAYGTVLVQGLGDEGERFFEFVEFLRGKGAQVISDPPFLLGSPAGRTYSVTQNSLQLAMSSGTYDVQTRTTSLRGGL